MYNLIFADSDFEHVVDMTVIRFTSVFIFLISFSLLMMLFIPPADEMLQFMDESGLINIYLIVLSFLLSPVNEMDYIRFEGEIEAMKLQGQFYMS